MTFQRFCETRCWTISVSLLLALTLVSCDSEGAPSLRAAARPTSESPSPEGSDGVDSLVGAVEAARQKERTLGSGTPDGARDEVGRGRLAQGARRNVKDETAALLRVLERAARKLTGKP